MRILDEIKIIFDEIRTEDKKLFEKKKEIYLDKLLKMVKDELVDFSLMIKESESKLEILIKKNKPININNNNINLIGTPTSQSNNFHLRKTRVFGEEFENFEIMSDLRRKNDELLSD